MFNLVKAFIRWNWELDKPADQRAHNVRTAGQSITHAIQRDSAVIAYCGSSPLCRVHGELAGYTSETVSVRVGGCVATYDKRGRYMSRIPG